jgi:hypothetical protein
MKNRINAYKAYVDGLLKDAPEGTDWDEVIRQHLIQLNFFMHERFIHLIVTITFALMECIVMTAVVNAFSLPLAALFILILVLLVPYVGHYYLLENSVQYMYRQYDALLQKKGQNAFSIPSQN